MTYGTGQVEVKVTVRSVAGFSVMLEGWEEDEYGRVLRIACSSISDAATSNVWCASNRSSTFTSNVMQALTSIVTEWVQKRKPSVPTLLAYLASFLDLFKTSCASCGKWYIEDGAWGPLPPLLPVDKNSPTSRKHFSCPPL